jgi:hypothetical protein
MNIQTDVQKLINRKLQEAKGLTITAEKVPTGGDATGGMGGGGSGMGNMGGGGEGGGMGEEQTTIEVTCSGDCCDAIVQVLGGLKMAGAPIETVKCNGQEVDLNAIDSEEEVEIERELRRPGEDGGGSEHPGAEGEEHVGGEPEAGAERRPPFGKKPEKTD